MRSNESQREARRNEKEREEKGNEQEEIKEGGGAEEKKGSEQEENLCPSLIDIFFRKRMAKLKTDILYQKKHNK